MDLAADALERVVVVRLERLSALLLQVADLRFDRRLVDASRCVVLARVDAERFAKSRQQMVLVQLRVALDGVLVLHAFRNFAKFLNRFLFQLVVGVSHGSSETRNSITLEDYACAGRPKGLHYIGCRSADLQACSSA